MKGQPISSALSAALVVGAIAAIAVPNTRAQTFAGFEPQQTFPVGDTPVSVAMGDLNGDGAIDLAVANEGAMSNYAGTVSILLGDGVGGFAPQQTFPVGNAADSVAMGDLDGDGDLDLAVANFDSDTVSILLGDGFGSFAPQQTFPVGDTPFSVALGDLNGDGALDLAVPNFLSDNVSILLGDGAGAFAPQQTFTTGSGPASVVMDDLNADGALDLAVPNSDSDNVSILLGDGAGGFAPHQTFAVGSAPMPITIGDLNRDGAFDLTVPNRDNDNVSILLGDGAGSFAPQQTFPAGALPNSVAIGDLNGDGDLDLAVANAGASPDFAGSVSILLGDGAGGFAPQQTFPAGALANSVAMGDLDGDGFLDVVVANGLSDSVSILINQTAVCPASPDLNGDGVVDGADLANLLANWGQLP